jgi:hypothetical protein
MTGFVTLVTTLGMDCTGVAVLSYPSWPLFFPHVNTMVSVQQALALLQAAIPRTCSRLNGPAMTRGEDWTCGGGSS